MISGKVYRFFTDFNPNIGFPVNSVPFNRRWIGGWSVTGGVGRVFALATSH